MGLIKGSASFVRFAVEGDLPENTWDFIAERVALYSFKDIDESYDESSIGWVSLKSMFDSDFAFGGYAYGNYVSLSLRYDERRVSTAILKKFVLKEEERIKKERQIPKISRSMKTEIKERIHSELIKKSFPFPSIYDVAWNIGDSTLLFFSTNAKAQALLEDHFKKTFGMTLIQQVPYITAEHLQDEDGVEMLSKITPGVFI